MVVPYIRTSSHLKYYGVHAGVMGKSCTLTVSRSFCRQADQRGSLLLQLYKWYCIIRVAVQWHENSGYFDVLKVCFFKYAY